MAISIDATVGGASANSYITLADANSIVEGLVADDDVAAWDGSSNDNKNRALYTAAVRIDRERFLGARVTDTQALQWPRQGVRKPDTYINTYRILGCLLSIWKHTDLGKFHATPHTFISEYDGRDGDNRYTYLEEEGPFKFLNPCSTMAKLFFLVFRSDK